MIAISDYLLVGSFGFMLGCCAHAFIRHEWQNVKLYSSGLGIVLFAWIAKAMFS